MGRKKKKETRAEMLERIKKQIKRGKYLTDEKISIAAEEIYMSGKLSDNPPRRHNRSKIYE